MEKPTFQLSLAKNFKVCMHCELSVVGSYIVDMRRWNRATSLEAVRQWNLNLKCMLPLTVFPSLKLLYTNNLANVHRVMCTKQVWLQDYLLQQNKTEYLSNGLLNSLNHHIVIQRVLQHLLKLCWYTKYFRCLTAEQDLCSMLHGSRVGAEFGGEWVHVYVWLCPCTVWSFDHTVNQLLTQYKTESFLRGWKQTTTPKETHVLMKI